MKPGLPALSLIVSFIVALPIWGDVVMNDVVMSDVVMRLETIDYSLSEPRVETTRMAIRPGEGAGLLKMDIRSASADEEGRNHTLIFRGGEESSITVIDHRKKSFSVIDRDAIAAFSTEMQIMMQATTMRIESLPPEQRAIVQKMLESQVGKTRQTEPVPSTVLKTHERETLSGRPSLKYEVFDRGEKLREVWVASTTTVPGGESALVLLQGMSDFYSTLMDSVDRTVPGLGGGFRVDQNPFEDLDRMEGFPVLTRNFAEGRVKTEIVLHSAEEQSLSSAEFEPPEGYQPLEGLSSQ